MNTSIQGTAADMIKLAMIHVATALKKARLQTRMLLQVHDELLFEMPESEVDQARTIILDAMKNALPLEGVPVEVEAGTGLNWLQAH
jgi:DNA polymerase-1